MENRGLRYIKTKTAFYILTSNLRNLLYTPHSECICLCLRQKMLAINLRSSINKVLHNHPLIIFATRNSCLRNTRVLAILKQSPHCCFLIYRSTFKHTSVKLQTSLKCKNDVHKDQKLHALS